MAGQYRLKNLVDAFQWTGDMDSAPIWFRVLNTTEFVSDGTCWVLTPDGMHHVAIGDWIIRGGGIYVCSNAAFQRSYEPVD